MNPDTQNIINDTLGNPMNPKTASFMPTGNRFSRFLDWLKSHKKLTLTILAILILLIFLLSSFASPLLNRLMPNPDGSPADGTAPELKPTSLMQIKTPKTTFTLNEKIPVTLVASSSDIPITAFDTAFEYDSEFLTITKRNPFPLSSFDYFGKNNATTAHVSAVLKPDQTPVKFDNTTLFEIEFTPKKAGKTAIKLIYMPSSTSESNLLNNESQDILGSARGIEITIQ